MTEQTWTRESTSKTPFARILRRVVQWTVLALLAFTCIMAAYRKFGG